MKSSRQAFPRVSVAKLQFVMQKKKQLSKESDGCFFNAKNLKKISQKRQKIFRLIMLSMCDFWLKKGKEKAKKPKTKKITKSKNKES